MLRRRRRRPVFDAPGPGALPAGQQTAVEWIAPREVVPDFAPAPRPAEPSLTGATLEWGAPVTFRAMPAIAPAPQNEAEPAVAMAAETQAHGLPLPQYR